MLLATAIGLVYGNSLSAPFIFDDTSTIIENPSIRKLWPLWGDAPGTAPLNPPAETAVYARPLVNLSFAVNYHFGELDPRGYRAAHLVMHWLAALLLWGIVTRTLRLDHFEGKFTAIANYAGFCASLVWALHPLVTEGVMYVTQRTELLMGFFYLVTLYCSLRYWETRSKQRLWLVLAAAACLAGIFCKEMIASAPAMVWLYERTFLTGTFRAALRRSWPLYVVLLLSWIPAIALNYHGPRTPMTGFELGVSAPEWWLTQMQVFFLYLKLAVWPWPLVIHYEVPYLNSVAAAWPWLLASSFYAICAIALVWRRSAIGYVMIWIVAVLSPTLVIPLVGETVAERRMYIPLTALVALLIACGFAILDKQRLPVMTTLMAVLAVGLGWLSRERLTAYETELALWQDAAQHQPHDPVVRANVGITLTEAGRIEEAIPEFEAWVELRPDSHWAHYNLARALEATAETEGAIEHYTAAISHFPEHGASHYNLARLLEDKSEFSQAIDHYRQAIAAQPEFAVAHKNLGLLLQRSGELPSAIEHFQAADRIEGSLESQLNLMLALMDAGRRDEAIDAAEKALSLARDEGSASVIAEIENIRRALRAQEPPP